MQLLTTALVRGNEKSKVFKDSGMAMNEWVFRFFGGRCSPDQLANGSKLVPAKSWRKFDLSDPEQVKAFLAPGNFKLVKK